MDKIFDEIVKHDIISFDIFDTLLIRPFARAKDIFKFIELNENATGFAISREKAEIEARVKNPKDEDVTIDEIYNFIEEKFKRVKTKEIEIEEQILQVNSKIKEYFDFALSLGKKIVLVSDSYLTKDILEIILNRRGYSGYNKIYISSEYRKTKHSGKLFQVVQEDLKTKNILHIGDNKYSDYTVPKNLGWDAICIKKPVDIYLDHDSRAKNLYNKQSDNLEISILFGILAIYYINKSNNYWKDFGFKYAGPAIYAYTSWIYREACKDNIENILFISQESYSLRKVFEILYPDKHFNTQYVYVPQGLDAFLKL
jgi:HAD superfamily hydrolase (TIGR01549 family)